MTVIDIRQSEDQLRNNRQFDELLLSLGRTLIVLLSITVLVTVAAALVILVRHPGATVALIMLGLVTRLLVDMFDRTVSGSRRGARRSYSRLVLRFLCGLQRKRRAT